MSERRPEDSSTREGSGRMSGTDPASRPPPPPESGGVHPPPRGRIDALLHLLSRPAGFARGPASPGIAAMLAAAAVCLAAYGAMAGFFDGGWQIAVGALKAPLVVLGALALCLPSLVVFHLLAGEPLSWGGFLRLAAAVGALLGLLLVSLTPVVWLFSVTSRSLGFLVVFHGVLFSFGLLLALGFLRRVLTVPAARRTAVLWAVLLWWVTVQLASYLGPLLHREPDEPLFPLRRGTFVETWAAAVETPAEHPPTEDAEHGSPATPPSDRPGTPID